MTEHQQLLADYVDTGSEPAFRELVARYIDLVYSTALRLVNSDAHLAEDVTQTVFADLARMARKLSRDSMLGGWLHRHTCFVARDIMRRERRRQSRERQAVEMNSMEDHSEANLKAITPILDDAINQLGAEDRAAIVLRFFEQKDFPSVGREIGGTEESARKRVSRAVDKLHALLTRRGVVLSVTGLAATLSAHAVSAAPVGLALTISTAALATAAAGGGTALTFFQIMSMTKLQAGIVTVVVAALAIPLAMVYRSNNQLRTDNESMRQQLAQIERLSAENTRLSNLLAEAKPAPSVAADPTNEPSREVLKLRGEIGRLKTAANAPKPSAISGVIADPEMRKMLRNQQKIGMGMIYQSFTNKVKLTPELAEKFVNLLADDIMESVDQVQAVLRDGKSPDEVNLVFTEQEAALQEKVNELLGADGLAHFQEYTKNLASLITAEQFKAQMTGDKNEKEEKAKQLNTLMEEETRAVLAEAGLPENFQMLPILNFRNMASEEEGERNLKHMDTVYERVTSRASSFLSEAELKKFSEFRAQAIQNSRMSLAMNRKMMAPANK